MFRVLDILKEGRKRSYRLVIRCLIFGVTKLVEEKERKPWNARRRAFIPLPRPPLTRIQKYLTTLLRHRIQKRVIMCDGTCVVLVGLVHETQYQRFLKLENDRRT